MPAEDRRHMSVTEQQKLIEERHDAADRKFEDFDFGASRVEDAEGWSYTNEGQEMTRTVYFENSEDPEADSVRGHFTVRFDANTDVIAEAYGSLGGHLIEDKPAEASGPRP